MSSEFLYLITARGGSKGVPGKNLQKIGGLSLVGFKARSALKAKTCSRLIISTEDSDIQDEAASLGVEVPFTRPANLATDTATSDAVVRHAMEHMETVEGRQYDWIMVLEPSSPFARAQDYDNAVGIALRHDASLVVGVRETEVNSIFTGPLGENGSITGIVEKFTGLDDLRRQALTPEYTMNGSLYLVRWETFKKAGGLYGDPENAYGYPMDPYHSVEIETYFDLGFARFLTDNGDIDMAEWK
jgi:CMP-N-acetylneuraminic acid synthetase